MSDTILCMLSFVLLLVVLILSLLTGSIIHVFMESRRVIGIIRPFEVLLTGLTNSEPSIIIERPENYQTI